MSSTASAATIGEVVRRQGNAAEVGDDVVVRDVTKSYGRRKQTPFVALQDVNLYVSPGEFVAIIGASGCGKTTLLRAMCGLTLYDSGEIYIGKQLVDGIPPNVGFAFQDPSLLAWRTVWQNVEIGLSARSSHHLSGDERRERVQAQLELMGLLPFKDFHPYEISGGMQQRVGLARALVGLPSLLLLDEPLGALDAFTRIRLQEELAGLLMKQRCTAVLVTHDVDEALFLADRVVIMSPSPGRIKAELNVPFERPRDRTSYFELPEIVKLRVEILESITGHRTAAAAVPSQ